MKRLISILLLLLFSSASFAQNTIKVKKKPALELTFSMFEQSLNKKEKEVTAFFKKKGFIPVDTTVTATLPTDTSVKEQVILLQLDSLTLTIYYWKNDKVSSFDLVGTSGYYQLGQKLLKEAGDAGYTYTSAENGETGIARRKPATGDNYRRVYLTLNTTFWIFSLSQTFLE
jgi:hypothetical protein